MALYSGFASREQQQLYDTSLQCILGMFVKRLLKFYTNEPSDDLSFSNAISKAYHALLRLQQHKYREPKLSKPIRRLVQYTSQHFLQHNNFFVIDLEKVASVQPQHIELRHSGATGVTGVTGLVPHSMPKVYFSGSRVPRSESVGVARPWTGKPTTTEQLSSSKVSVSENMSQEEIDREILRKYVKGGSISFKPNLPRKGGLRAFRKKPTQPPHDNFLF